MSSLPPSDPTRSRSAEELAKQAEVPVDFVHRLVELDGLRANRDGQLPSLRRRAYPHPPRLGGSGLSAEDIMELVRAGELSISWLDTPVITRRCASMTFEQLCSEEGAAHDVQSLYEAIGFAPPEPTDRIRAGDRELVTAAGVLRSRGRGGTNAAIAPGVRGQPAPDRQGRGGTVRVRDRGAATTLRAE